MQFLTNKDEQENEQDEIKKKLIDSQKGQVKCRLCKEDHWTKQCPYKDKLEPLRSSLLVWFIYLIFFHFISSYGTQEKVYTVVTNISLTLEGNFLLNSNIVTI